MIVGKKRVTPVAYKDRVELAMSVYGKSGRL